MVLFSFPIESVSYSNSFVSNSIHWPCFSLYHPSTLLMCQYLVLISDIKILNQVLSYFETRSRPIPFLTFHYISKRSFQRLGWLSALLHGNWLYSYWQVMQKRSTYHKQASQWDCIRVFKLEKFKLQQNLQDIVLFWQLACTLDSTYNEDLLVYLFAKWTFCYAFERYTVSSDGSFN